MYSRSTDRGGRRIKLPPGYDGNAFRHDTGEIRRLGGETEMKIHSPAVSERNTEAVEAYSEDEIQRVAGGAWAAAGENRPVLTGQWQESTGEGNTRTVDGEDDTGRMETETDTEQRPETVPAELCRTAGREVAADGKGNGSLLEGLLGSLGSEDWLLFLVILLLVADGSDAWDLILLLGVLLAVK